MNQTISLLHNRCSIRSYLDRPISNLDLNQINGAIYRSPTAGNMQDFSVIVVTDQAVKDQLAVLCDNQLFIKTAPIIYIFVADYTRYTKYFELSDVDQSNLPTPHLGSMVNSMIDSTIAAQTASIAANSLGIGTCYIGDIIEHKEQVTTLLNLTDQMIPVAMLTMGYFEQAIKASPKIDKKFIFHHNQYTQPTNEDITTMFEEKKIPKKYREQYDNFGQYYYATKVGADFSVEMDRSVREYIKNYDHQNK